jgi:hypothetical protein
MVSDGFNSGLGLNTLSVSTLGGGGGGDDEFTRRGGGTPPPTGPSIPISIYTNEINPLQHAAELGEAIANRVG